METTYKNYASYNDLSRRAKEIVDKCHRATMVSPLEYCRMILEDAKGHTYYYAREAEQYLMYEA